MLEPHRHRPSRLRRGGGRAARAVAVRRGAAAAGTARHRRAGARAAPRRHRSRTSPTPASRRRGCRCTATPDANWDLYQLGEELVDLEDAFRLWRFRHLTTVQRIIGFKQGTGGTSGVGYLHAMLATELFPELWSIRTAL